MHRSRAPKETVGRMAQARALRAEEDRVLSHVRRAAALATTTLAALLPLVAVVLDGAKRW